VKHKTRNLLAAAATAVALLAGNGVAVAGGLLPNPTREVVTSQSGKTSFAFRLGWTSSGVNSGSVTVSGGQATLKTGSGVIHMAVTTSSSTVGRTITLSGPAGSVKTVPTQTLPILGPQVTAQFKVQVCDGGPKNCSAWKTFNKPR
jgi:hypothetical protein